MKNRFIFFLCCIIFFSFKASSKNLNENQSSIKPLFTALFFIDIEHCLACDRITISSNLVELSKLPNTRVVALVHSLFVEDFLLYKKSITADEIIWDSTGIAEQFQIHTTPGFVVINKTGNILYQCDDLPHRKVDIHSFAGLLKSFSYDSIPGIVLDKSENGVLGQVRSPYINFQDSTLTAIDALRNSISTYSLTTGKLIRSIEPDYKLPAYSQKALSPKEAAVLEANKAPVVTYKYIAPLKNSNGYVTISSIIKSVLQDSTVEVKDKDTTIRTKNTIQSRSIGVVYNGSDSISDANIPVGPEFTCSYLKLRDSLYYMTIGYTKINLKKLDEIDTIYTHYVTTSPTLTNGRFFLPYSKIKSAYNLTKFNKNTIGILEYNTQKNQYIYANVWNNVFCFVTPAEEIISIKPIGSALLTFANYEEDKNKSVKQTDSDSLVFFMNGILSNSQNFYVLIQANTKQRLSGYCIIQEYDLSGRFIREIPILIEDKLQQIHLVSCTDNELYLLGKSLKRGWEVKSMKIKR